MIDNIEEKQNKLIEIGNILKSKYHGIDNIIDNIIGTIETWYIFDEVLYKPLIISLFGLTGCGKTSLVRDLAKLLNMYEKFAEIDLTKSPESIRGYYQGGPVGAKLHTVIEDTDCKGIFLIDEIQKIKESNTFNEIWSLLSDGKLGSGHFTLNRIDSTIRTFESFIEEFIDAATELEYMKSMAQDKSEYQMRGWNPTTQSIPLSKKYVIDMYLDIIKIEDVDMLQPLFDWHDFGVNKTGFMFGFSNMIKKNFSEGSMSIKDILNIPGYAFVKPLLVIARNYRKQLIDKYNAITSRDPLVFSKLLIFITGNVDGLYVDSKNIDISADELHDKTMKLTYNDLKNELLKVFKPEEVSRFGGNFIIYPSLSMKAFQMIIDDKLTEIETDVQKITGISISLKTKKFLNHLEQVSVVASLGARPLISKIYTEVNNVVPKLIKIATLKGLKSISISSLRSTEY